MASSPITSWEIDREIMETATDFISLFFKITVDGDCSHEVKRHHFAENGPHTQSYGFSSSHVRSDSCTIKKPT